MVYSYLRRRGETGRRAGLKILWTNHPCRFESDRRHQRKNNLANNREVVFSYIRASRVFTLEIVWIYEKKTARRAVARLFVSAVGGIIYRRALFVFADGGLEGAAHIAHICVPTPCR